MAPAKPRAAPPALMCAPAPAELDVLAPVDVPLAEPADPEAAAPEPEAAAVEEALMTEVMDPDMETVTVPLPYGTVFKPVERPAGNVARVGWEVTTAGWTVTAIPPAGWEVTTAGIPVMTPLEFVSVRYWVFGLLYAGVETEDWAETAAAKTAERRTNDCILRLLMKIILY